jgi:hypothetical protein
MDYPAAPSFRKAGYTAIETNASYTGGLVRQYANVSFSRVFEAGHTVAAYQPETVFRIFQRAMSRKDVATGGVDIQINKNYSTSGPLSSFATKNDMPAADQPSVCYLYVLGSTCTPDELAALANGTATVKDYVVTLSVAANGGGAGNNSSPGGNRTTPRNAVGKLGASMLGISLLPLLAGFGLLGL